MRIGLGLFLALWIVTASASAQGTPSPPRPPARSGNADAGKTLYMRMTCYYCHGTAGQGGSAGVRIAMIQRSPDAFIRYIRRPTGQMPAYTDRLLTDDQLTDVYAFLRSLPPARPAKDIPLLAQPQARK
jgi:mono/diheme cytochrome c family protein